MSSAAITSAMQALTSSSPWGCRLSSWRLAGRTERLAVPVLIVHTLLDLLQAAGIGAAVGIRPFLPALLVGALAAANLGIDFDGTNFSFLEKPPFLLVML